MDSLLKQFAQSSQLGANAAYIEELYERYLVDPDSVDAKWKAWFDGFAGREAGDVPHSVVMEAVAAAGRRAARGHGSGSGAADERERHVGRLITAYRSRGHLGAKLDPLGLVPPLDPPDLGLPFHNLSDGDLDAEFSTGGVGGQERMRLRDLLALLKATYTGPIGAEFMHITDAEQRRWLYERLERAGGSFDPGPERRRRILERLTAAEGLERYLHTKYVGQKRFSLEGGDALIPLLDTLIHRAGSDGVKDIVIGMAHRGRLNVLVNTLGKPPRRLFDEFEGKFDHKPSDDPAHTGDVKYHMGFSADVQTPSGPVHLALAFNPSHLEIVDPVVVGSVRSRQHRRGDKARKQVIPVLLHGDAAFAGQGVVMELFQMSQARGFAVGGTVHVVINNQVGFTTSDRQDARSTLYCTDVAKMVGAPVLHVNADDPEAVVFCIELAYAFRQQFGKDVVIDLVCYRRHGHNESDEPAATQPLMYQTIRKHPTPRELYAKRLVEGGGIPEEDAKRLVDDFRDKLDAGAVTTELADTRPDDYDLTIDWGPYLSGRIDDPVDTSVDPKRLKALADAINTIPDEVKLHARVAKIYEDRRRMAAGEIPGDWGFAENLAYATLLDEGHKLRLVGQDSGRGTFFHRHAVLHDQNSGEDYIPLQQLVKNPEDATIIDSLLSEEAVMAFEYGYSTSEPGTLDIWEAQFGDFANGAQVVIDQFVSSGEAKWQRLSGLALFLPHGYEGQGPEHSSARLERFLQLCALENMFVCVPTTSAQAFHMIRRQLCMKTRKPLVVMTPKSLLRHKLAASPLEDLSGGSFRQLIADEADPKKVKRVVACSGKVYYDLLEEQRKQSLEQVALIRVEQLYPFPREALAAELARYGKGVDLVWCQEEPQNQGAWYQIKHHLDACLGAGQKLHYAGRSRSPSPAVGHFNDHVEEQKQLIADALVNKLKGKVAAE
ncbi:2-oxoglutarate dehydrogenase E1 component [Luteimonas sp. RD2P54]|uniref:oxoglutarate dehydrogenase (succinyl-transferring) n=1 Tax=Luteimonas endophytica TaxID=3042023 RepID=A0ABT6JAJ9_9GAMM|nr:2-oxoglutarate dehydrogenase E1 component [Luteimonas endophytica]MDH5823208.1 2-oxoglutarate dehydrogenase E1 component [Luteimonas endophytica]